jgi:predicted amidohydrolase YtcJ
MTLLRNVEVDGAVVDVRVGEAVEEIGRLARDQGEDVIEGRGGVLLPGLHDHHLHLLALAAADASIDVSGGLDALRSRDGSGWLRAVGWSGDGDRHDLDKVVSDRPVRVQHRSGALWVVNSMGLQALTLDDSAGIELDAHGEPTGRLWRLDAWLGEQVGREPPDLGAVAIRLLRLGITGVTDATPKLDRATCDLLRTSVPLRLLLLGDAEGSGPYKLLLPDHNLPAYDELLRELGAIRPRPVAVHCVTREALVLLLTALDEVGHVRGDRIEHASLVPIELTRLPCAVVTQPGFLLARGDDYLRDVNAADVPDLYRYRSLREAGSCVVPSSDAPYGPLDPWATLCAARDRASATGVAICPDESVSTRTALEGMLRPLQDLDAPPRTVHVGAPADLVLLDAPLEDVLLEPAAERVKTTLLRGLAVG